MSKDVAYYLENPDELPDDPELLEALASEGEIKESNSDKDVKSDSDAENQAEKASPSDKADEAETQDDDGIDEIKESVEKNPDGVLTRDGKSVIPYRVLAGARHEASTLREENEALKSKIAEYDSRRADAMPEKPVVAQTENQSQKESLDDRISAEFQATYGMSYEEFSDEYGDEQAKIMRGPITSNIKLRDKLLEIESEHTKYRNEAEKSEQDRIRDELQDAIDSNPTLSDWQQNNPRMWAAATGTDKSLFESDPDYAALPTRERLEKLVELFSVSSKTSTEQPKKDPPTVDEKAEEALRNAKKSVPNSLSSFPAGGDPAAQTELEAIENMSVTQLEKLLSDPKREAEILANL